MYSILLVVVLRKFPFFAICKRKQALIFELLNEPNNHGTTIIKQFKLRCLHDLLEKMGQLFLS